MIPRIKQWLTQHKALDNPERYYDIYSYEKERYTNPFVYQTIYDLGWCEEDVLDIGCGDGRTMRGKKKYGMEISRLYCQEAWKNGIEVTWQGRFENYSVVMNPKKFSTVVCGDVIEHLKDWKSQVHRICYITLKYLAITRSDDDKQRARNDPHITKIIEMQHDPTCTVEAIIEEVLKHGFKLIERIEFEEINNLLLFERVDK